MGNFTYEDLEEYKYWEDTNNYDKFLDYVDMQSAICQKNRYEKDFPNYMRRIFIEHDIMFKKTLKMIETKKLSKSKIKRCWFYTNTEKSLSQSRYRIMLICILQKLYQT